MVDLIVVWCIAVIVVLGLFKVRGIVFNAGKRLTRVFLTDGASNPVKMKLENKNRSDSRHQQLHEEHTDNELALPLAQDTNGVPDGVVTPPPLPRKQELEIQWQSQEKCRIKEDKETMKQTEQSEELLMNEEEMSQRHQQLHEEHTDNELALPLAQDTNGVPDGVVTPPPLRRSAYVIQLQKQLAAKKHDLSKWKYSDLQNSIHTSCDVLKASAEECRRRLKVYHSWKVKNMQKRSVGRMQYELVTKVESVEVLWKIRNASKKLSGEGLIPETRRFSIAGDEWTVVLKIEGGNLILNLKKKALSSSIPKMFWSVGIQDCDGHIVYMWYDKPVELHTLNRKSGEWECLPGISYLDTKGKALWLDDTLTIFVRLGRYPTVEKIPKDL